MGPGSRMRGCRSIRHIGHWGVTAKRSRRPIERCTARSSIVMPFFVLGKIKRGGQGAYAWGLAVAIFSARSSQPSKIIGTARRV